MSNVLVLILASCSHKILFGITQKHVFTNRRHSPSRCRQRPRLAPLIPPRLRILTSMHIPLCLWKRQASDESMSNDVTRRANITRENSFVDAIVSWAVW